MPECNHALSLSLSLTGKRTTCGIYSQPSLEHVYVVEEEERMKHSAECTICFCCTTSAVYMLHEISPIFRTFFTVANKNDTREQICIRRT